MLKTVVIILVTYAIGFSAVVGCVKQTHKDIRPMLEKQSPIVKLYRIKKHWFKPDKQKFMCTGFVVNSRTLFTAAHCTTEGPLEVRGTNDAPTGIFAKLKGANHRMDVAILTGDFKDFETLPILTNTVKILTTATQKPVLACGYPYGGNLFCSGLAAPHQSNFGIAAQGFLYPGMSGGPVFDTETAEVIGINSAVWQNEVQVALIVEIYKACNVEPEP